METKDLVALADNMDTNTHDTEYARILDQILERGKWKGNRTGVDCLTIAGAMFEHDMADGFPLLTRRKLPFKSTKVELEFFIKGLRSKKWLQDRGCKYWDGWCNPQMVPYGNDEETKKKMAAEDDLGLIYGTQWRDFHEPDHDIGGPENVRGRGIDQLENIVNTLKTNPSDRRMICNSWNPLSLQTMALPPCHYSWQVTVIDGYLNLAWNQRSCDYYLGIPANISSYALLLHLLAKEANLKEGKLIGFLMDTHVYSNHMVQIEEFMKRPVFAAPSIKTEKWNGIFNWEYTDTELVDYKSGDVLTASVAI